ncbi:unnamed protein product [Camellia sinensis]
MEERVGTSCGNIWAKKVKRGMGFLTFGIAALSGRLAQQAISLIENDLRLANFSASCHVIAQSEESSLPCSF